MTKHGAMWISAKTFYAAFTSATRAHSESRAQEARLMKQLAKPAVMVMTDRGDDCRGYQPREGWEDFCDALQRLNGETPEDIPGLLDFEDGYAVFEASSDFGQRALAAGEGTIGVVLEGDALFLEAPDPVAARADALQEAGATPGLYEEDPVYFYNWTFFAARR